MALLKPTLLNFILVAAAVLLAFFSFSVPAHAACNVPAGCTGQTSFVAGIIFQGSDPLRLSSKATSTPIVGNGLSYTGTLGDVIGGIGGTLSATLGTTIAPNELVGTPGANLIIYTNGPGTGFAGAATSSLFGFTPASNATTITIAGTANQITSSAGAQDLSANRTWTLSLPSLIIQPNASTTLFSNLTKAYFGATATTTIDSTGNIVIPSGSGLTNTGRSDGCATWTTGLLTSTGIACGSGSGSGLSTSSPLASSNLLVYSTAGAGSAYGVATGTVSGAGGVTVTAGQSIIGTGLTITCTAASAGATGCLSSTDWSTFNSKVSTTRAINTTYPLQGGGDLSADRTLTIAFGTTTSNTWAGTQTFTNTPILGTLTGVIYGNNGALSARATTTVTCAGTVACTTFDILGASPITITGSGGGTGIGTVSTSSQETAGQLAVWGTTNGYPAKLYSLATSSESITGPFNIPATHGSLVGGSAGITYWGLATTSQPASSNVLTSNGAAGVYGTATSSATCTSGITCTNVAVFGSSPTITINANALALDRLVQGAANTVIVNQTGGTANFTALATSTFANGLYAGTAGQVLYRTSAGTWVGTATTTAGTGLSYNGTSFNVNATQSITGLTNLATDGIVYTSGGVGTLNVDAGALDIVRGGTATTTFRNGGVVFYNSTLGTLAQSANTLSNELFWDNTNGRLGVGTSSPNKLFTVEGNQAGGIANIQRDVPGNSAFNTLYGTFAITDLQATTTGMLASSTGPSFSFNVSTSTSDLNSLADIWVQQSGNTNYGGSFNVRAANGTKGSFSRTLTLDGPTGIFAIGSSSPSSQLCTQDMCVVDTAGAAGFVGVSGTGASQVRFLFNAATAGSAGQFGTISNHDVQFFTNNSLVATLTTGGRFGLGTSTPYKTLSVGGDIVVGAATAGGTIGDLFLPKLATAAGAFLAVDPTGKVIATTTPAAGGGGTTVTSYASSTFNGAGGPVDIIAIPVVANDVILAWANGQTSCANANGQISLELKQSTMAASATPIVGNTWGGNSGAAGCNEGVTTRFVATTTETINVEARDSSFNSILVQKLH